MPRAPRSAASLGVELVQRAEREVLEPVDLVQLVGVDEVVDPPHRRIGAGVAVGDRVGEQAAAGIEQAVVHRPRVDADRLDGRELAAERPQAVADLVVQPADVPPQVPVGLAHPVREAVHRVERHRRSGGVRVDDTGDDAAPGGADVDSGEDAGRHGGQRRNAAATPASTGTWRPVVWLNSLDVIAVTALATCSGSTSRLSSVRWA